MESDLYLPRNRGLADAQPGRQFLLCAAFQKSLDDDRSHLRGQFRQSFIEQRFHLAPRCLLSSLVHLSGGGLFITLARGIHHAPR